MNHKKLGSNLDSTQGGIANEARFAEKNEYRSRKLMTLPSLNEGICRIEQGWYRVSNRKDVIKLTMIKKGLKIDMIFRRIDLEQCLFAMAQDDEVIKYFKNEARGVRKYAEN